MAKKMWGGRFQQKTHPLVEDFTKSIDYDWRLAKYDVIGSLAHVIILKRAEFLSAEEAAKLTGALNKILDQIEKGTFKFDQKAEDVHTNIQNALEEKVGSLVLKLHTARSRNDQIVFDVKLFCKAELDAIQKLAEQFKNTLVKAAKKAKDIVIPGYTHLQQAQLVHLSDYLASYVEMFKRDIKKIESTKNGIHLTLGSGALAGTPIKSKNYNVKIKDIEIFAPMNSIDNVSSRDFIAETLSALAIVGIHTSRLAEDLIIWSTKEFDFVEISDAFATGSSLMPQKKNPDVLELIRGYAGILSGNLVSFLTIMKGLPSSYNRDMQLDKIPLFSSIEIIKKELKVLAKLIDTLRWNTEVISKKIASEETIYATDLVYYLVKKGEPFRDAHDIIGKLIAASLKHEKSIRKMSDAELKKFSAKLKHSEILKLMNPAASVKSRVSMRRPIIR